ncbi:unnamed protein product, partial [Musa banksii]
FFAAAANIAGDPPHLGRYRKAPLSQHKSPPLADFCLLGFKRWTLATSGGG